MEAPSKTKTAGDISLRAFIESLRDPRETLENEDAFRIVRESAQALAALHREGKVHGAVCPDAFKLAGLRMQWIDASANSSNERRHARQGPQPTAGVGTWKGKTRRANVRNSCVFFFATTRYKMHCAGPHILGTVPA